MKALYYGDNLRVLRVSIATESVDLIYLDPPFNSKAIYNVCLLGRSVRDRMRGPTAAYSQEPTSAIVLLPCYGFEREAPFELFRLAHDHLAV